MTNPIILYLPHGGGPLPLLADPAHVDLTAFLRRWPQTITTPKEIVVVSAHWEAHVPTITGGAMPSLIYDYNGFPPEAYDIQYNAPGSPALASRLSVALHDAGFAPVVDESRGYDHGLLVPLKLMYPQA